APALGVRNGQGVFAPGRLAPAGEWALAGGVPGASSRRSGALLPLSVEDLLTGRGRVVERLFRRLLAEGHRFDRRAQLGVHLARAWSVVRELGRFLRLAERRHERMLLLVGLPAGFLAVRESGRHVSEALTPQIV